MRARNLWRQVPSHLDRLTLLARSIPATKACFCLAERKRNRSSSSATTSSSNSGCMGINGSIDSRMNHSLSSDGRTGTAPERSSQRRTSFSSAWPSPLLHSISATHAVRRCCHCHADVHESRSERSQQLLGRHNGSLVRISIQREQDDGDCACVFDAAAAAVALPKKKT